MDITLTIPDEIAGQLLAGGEDLRRRALESLAPEELRAGRISEAQLAMGFQEAIHFHAIEPEHLGGRMGFTGGLTHARLPI